MNTAALAIIIVLFGIGVGIIGVSYKVPYTVEVEKEVQVPYEAQEPYEVKVPYEDKEPYQEQEPFQVTRDLSYKVVKASDRDCGSMFNYVYCTDISVENIDTEGGTFGVDCTFQTLRRRLTDSDSGYIGPGIVNTFTCSADIDYGEDVDPRYTVTPGTKTVTEYRAVTKYRTVTKYKTKTKYRTVIKYRTETQKETETHYRTLFEEWGIM